MYEAQTYEAILSRMLQKALSSPVHGCIAYPMS